MDLSKNISLYLVLILNLVLIIFFAGSYYNFVGWIMAAACIIALIFLRNNKVIDYIIIKQIQSNNEDSLLTEKDKEKKLILISVAFLILSMKVGVVLALIVEGAAVIIIAFCILIAFGWFFEGSASGMSPGIAYSIAKIVVKIYVFLNSLIDKIANLIVDIEFSVLGIEKR